MCVCQEYVVVFTRRVMVQLYAIMCTQLTTNRIGKLTRLVYNLLYVITVHAYILLWYVYIHTYIHRNKYH